ncbi:MAG: hypothetical protein ABI036_14420 [Fibrobacteria bacterium]
MARGSVVENEVTGIILTPEGPAVAARVRLYAADAGAGAGATRETATDSAGRFHFEGLGHGAYSVLCDQGPLLAFRDSIPVSDPSRGGKATVVLAPDTLRLPGAIQAQIILKSGDDLSTVQGEVLGTPFSAHADGSGDVSMTGMPPGRLRLRFTSTLPGYKALSVSVEVAPGRTAPAGALVLPY